MSSPAALPFLQQPKQKWHQNRWEISLVAILVFAFVVFLLVLPSYGASFDEPSIYPYADRSLDAYKSLFLGQPLPPFELTYALSYYGPAYLTIGRVGVGLIQAIAPRLDIYDAWHVMNFVNFLVGAWLSISFNPTGDFEASCLDGSAVVSHSAAALGPWCDES